MLSLNQITNAQSIVDHIGIRNPQALVAKFIGRGIGFRPEIKVASFHPPQTDRHTKEGQRTYMRAYRAYRRSLGKS